MSSDDGRPAAASGDRFKELVEAVADWVWEVDATGRTVYSSPRVKDLLGYEPDEVLGMRPTDLMPPDEAARLGPAIAQFLDKQTPFDHFDNIMMHKDGAHVHMETSGTPIHDADGNFIGFRGINRDISARRREQQQLAQREAQFRAIFESSPLGIMLVGTRARIVDANPAACELLGYDCGELRTKTMVELTHPDDVAWSSQKILAMVADSSQRNLQMEIRMIRKDGSTIWVNNIGTMMRDDTGAPANSLSIIDDVTDRRRAQEDLREQASFRKAIIESASDGLCVCHALEEHPFVEFTVWNDQMIDLTGYSMDEINSSGWYQTLYPDEAYRRKAIARMDRMRTGDNLVAEEWEIRRKDGQQAVISISTSLLQTADGKAHVLALMRDLTDRKHAEEQNRRLEAQVQHAQKLESLGVLAGGIAHDFNNLLVGILGNADLALSDLPPTSSARDRIDDIETAARRAADLCRQMLAYSGKGRFVIEALDLHRVIDEISRMLEVSISKRAVLKLNFADNLPTLQGDATQIRQVIMNLITNASEALGDRGGVISVSTGTMMCDRAYLAETYLDEDLPDGQYVFLEVADTGVGMDEATRSRMFEPFFSTKFTGRGLGMAAVLGIVRGHSAAIKVHSEPGKGTTVKVLFPASEQPALSGKIDSPEKGLKATGTILLADDEESVRTVARRMLERLGFDVMTAVDGVDALEKYRESQDRISCILLDLTMPRLDGEEAFRELRRVKGDVRVILSSGYNEQDVVQRFAGKGLTGFIQKPYQLAKLREVLRIVFRSDGETA
jgi:PAS domain S-box-containing protein